VGEGGGDVLVFVAQRIFLGTRTEKLEANPDQWREYGYNWDGLCTTSGGGGSAAVPVLGACKRPVAEPGGIPVGNSFFGFVDGNACRDNAFGGSIMPLLSLLQQKPEVGLDESLAAGSSTYLLRLSDVGLGSDDSYVPGELFSTLDGDVSPATYFPEAPQERVVDVRSAAYGYRQMAGGKTTFADWPEDGSSPTLPAGAVFEGGLTSRVRFPTGYMVGNTWVSGDAEDSRSSALLALGGFVARLDASAGILTVKMSERTASPVLPARSAQESRLSAVVSPQKLTDAVTSPGSPLLKCGQGASYTPEVVAKVLSELADLQSNGATGYPFVDTGKECDLLSFGVGIAWAPAKLAPKPGREQPFHYVCNGPVATKVPGAGGAAGAGGSAGAGGASGASGKAGAAGSF
jgi:hypothetical protein